MRTSLRFGTASGFVPARLTALAVLAVLSALAVLVAGCGSGAPGTRADAVRRTAGSAAHRSTATAGPTGTPSVSASGVPAQSPTPRAAAKPTATGTPEPSRRPQSDSSKSAKGSSHGSRVERDAHASTSTAICAIGDSVMVGAEPGLRGRFPGIVVDAKVSRQMSTLPDRIAALRTSGRLGRTVVIGLGTNGPFSSSFLDRQLRALGDRTIVLVNVAEPRSWESDVNATLAGAAARFGNVTVADWHAAVRRNPGLVGSDGIHLRGSSAARTYAQVIANALP